MEKKKGCFTYIGMAVVALIIIGAIAGVSQKNKETKIDNSKSTTAATQADGSTSAGADTTAAATEAAPQETVVKPGGSFEYDNLKVSFDDENIDFSVEDDKYGLHTPKDGFKYMTATFTATNTGNENDKYIGTHEFDCYADNKSCDQTYISSVSDFINTNLSPGRSVTFTIICEVPKDAKTVELEYSPMLSDERVVIQLQ
ncbi:MAG: DUF4352 domain-containing protein [Lachnospiraceae bacterium]|nr:DUF4352 domain-containing protein [Lachnospiraceae bacterium]